MPSHEQNPQEQWFYLKAEERIGPFDYATMQQLLQAGVIQSETWVAKQGDSDWTAAEVALRPLAQTDRIQTTSSNAITKKLKVCLRRYRRQIAVALAVLLAILVALSVSLTRHDKSTVDPIDSRVAEILIRGIDAWQVRNEGSLAKTLQKSERGDFNGGNAIPLDDPPATDIVREVNYDLKSFIQAFLSGDLQSVETIRDRWGHEFRVVLDGDGNGRINLDGSWVEARAFVWSLGQNGIDESGQGDDVSALLNWPPGKPPANPLIEKIPAEFTANLVNVVEFKKPLDIAFVAIGNPGNAPDPKTKSSFDEQTASGRFGAVGYEYQIAAFETTIGQYAAFLNAVASTDEHGLYTSDMLTDRRIAGIVRKGQPGSYTYGVLAGSEHKPITYVSWFDAARFANWLHNGQPDGTQCPTTTEDGTYTLNGAVNGVPPRKNAGAKYWIPTSDEWHKAAYYDPTKGRYGGYWQYPMRCDELNSNTIGKPNSANFYNGRFVGTGTTVYPMSDALTTVGAYGPNSASYYGTNDQGGNVWEWTDGVDRTGDNSCDGLKGGSWLEYYPEYRISNSGSYANWVIPWDQRANTGFRIASANRSK